MCFFLEEVKNVVWRHFWWMCHNNRSTNKNWLTYWVWIWEDGLLEGMKGIKIMDDKISGSAENAPGGTPGCAGKRTYTKSAASSSASRANLASAWEARKKNALGKMVTLKIPPELLAQIDVHTTGKTPRWKVVKAGLDSLEKHHKQARKKV